MDATGLMIRVTDPQGRPVLVEPANRIPVDYVGDGRRGNAVWEFRTHQIGEYRVTVTGSARAGTRLAVGSEPFCGLSTWMWVQLLGLAALWLTAVCASVVLVAVPGRGRRRGEQARRSALLALVPGLPWAFAAAAAWALAVGTWSPGGLVRAQGWRAVVYDVPAILLVLGMAVTSTALAGRALRSGARGARPALWAAAVGLALALAVLGTRTLDTVATGHSAALGLAVRIGALVVGVTVVGLVNRWAGAGSRRTQPTRVLRTR